MRKLSRMLFLSILLVTANALSACGTIRTMPALGSYDTPKIYSGTRLDLSAITRNESKLKRFSTVPPEHPLIDFPFSLLLDTIILPMTIPAATYELVFGD